MSFVPRTQAELALDFPPELEHVSASSLAMALRCEEQWRQRYILGKIQPPALNMLLGKADHRAIEYSMAQKIESHEDLPVGVVRDRFLDELETEVDRSGGLKEIEIKDSKTLPAKRKVYDKERIAGEALVSFYHQEVSPLVQPLYVEEEFSIDLPDLPVRMMGYIDIEIEKAVIDRKRSAQAISKPRSDWMLQAEIYQLVRPKPFAWHLSITQGRPRVVATEEMMKPVPPYERTLRFVQQIVAKLGFLYVKYGPDEPWPVTGKQHPWACSYCGFRHDCWGWKE